MSIDIRGVNTHNKGAHLMLIAITQALGELDLTMSPNGSAYDARSVLGLSQTLVLNQAPLLSAALSNCVPRGLRRAYGLAATNDLTGLLDAAGFAYSDSFSSERSRRELRLANVLDRKGVPRVFLPQAFGPFRDAKKADIAKRLLEPSSAVFARDRQSLEFVAELSSSIRVHLAPDFTVGVKSAEGDAPVPGNFIALVPNSKVLTHGHSRPEQYIDELVRAAGAARSKGLESVVVVHEFSDRGLAEQLSVRSGARVFEHSNPLVLKRVLADAQFVVASRFHAIIGGLSSLTPVIGFGWSHKYTELMEDFGVPDLHVSSVEELSDRVIQLLDGQLSLVALPACTEKMKLATSDMWADVRHLLDTSTKL